MNDVAGAGHRRDRKELEALLAASHGWPLRSESLSRTTTRRPSCAAVTRTLAHIVRARDALLKVNAAYIESATVDDALRGEPAFLLQGSYRNMARLAGRLVAAMTPDEVDVAVREHYQAEAQTLAAAAGWNLARLAELVDPDSAGRGRGRHACGPAGPRSVPPPTPPSP